MKRQIRYGVFETNSSSEHAICVPQKRIKKEEIKEERVDFDHETFYRKTQMYRDFQDKVNYLFQAIWDVLGSRCYHNEDKFKSDYSNACNNIYTILGKYGIDCSFTEKHTEVHDGGVYGTSYYQSRGSIDHGWELGEWVDTCLSHEKYLLTYLFGDSIVITGSDEGVNGYMEDVMKELDLDEYDVYYKYCG